MNFAIKNRWTGSAQFECELSAEVADRSYRVQLGFAVRKAIDSGADLRGADLSDADLRDADLRGADLRGADLRGADLSGADLSGADLSGAVLRDADLSDADLSGADLRGAVLRGADLSGADLRGAVLRGADLSGAVLSDADLSGAVLRDADLSDADLRGAVLRGADLSDADLRQIRADFYGVLSWAPHEVPALIAALKAGKVDGSTYTGECACLVGTIAKARDVDYASLEHDPKRPIERFFTAIREGDTPENNQACAIAVEWAESWLATMRAAFGAKAEAEA